MEVSLIREGRSLASVAARANGKTPGRPKRIFKRDEVVRLRAINRVSVGGAIAKELEIPVMTAVNTCQTSTVAAPEPPAAPAKTKGRKSAA